MNQKDTVLNHLQNVGHLTQMEAAQRYNIWRLAAVILKLREEGKIISTTMVKHKAGGKYASYRLEGSLGSPQNVIATTLPTPLIHTPENKRTASLTLDNLKRELNDD